MNRRRQVDPAIRSRRFWGAVVWIVAVVLLAFALPYLILGAGAATVPDAFAVVVRTHLPGALHTYGAVMALFALALLYGLLPTIYRLPMLDIELWWALRLTSAYALFLVVQFAGSWLVTGTPTWGALIYWGSISAICLAAVRWPPFDRGGRA